MLLKSSNRLNHISRLVLGTAQLGMDYGIANRSGKPDLKTAESIIKTAWGAGVREYDTAQGYGGSEKILGRCLSGVGVIRKAYIISKMHPGLNCLNLKKMRVALNATLNNLKAGCLYGYLLHREELLDQWGKGLKEILVRFVEKDKLIKNIGVSVYSPQRAIEALNTKYISIVQLPSNILDRRFENAGVFEIASKLKKTIYIRSIFLQGLLLMQSRFLPQHMKFTYSIIKKLEIFAKEIGLTVRELCLGYVKNAFPQAKIIFGVETPEQVIENSKCSDLSWPNGLNSIIRTEFRNIEDKVLNPFLWPRNNGSCFT